MKPISISIGIPAYNEAKNIKRVLKGLLQQKEDGVILKEIIVVSDGSSDNIAKKISEVKDPRIIFKHDERRLGKSARLDQIFRSFTGDILILSDADVTIKDTTLLKRSIAQANIKKTGIAGINVLPLPATTWVESILEAGVLMMKTIAKNWNNGNNYLSYKGAWLILDKKLAKAIHMPGRVINNDAYLYFSAVKHGYQPTYLQDCSVYYRSPKTIEDHVKQASRFQTSKDEMQQYFTMDWKKAYTMPKHIIAFSIGRSIMKRPVETVAYLGVNLFSHLNKQTGITSTWNIASSTK